MATEPAIDDNPLTIPADDPAPATPPAAAAAPDDAPTISDTEAALAKIKGDLDRERNARRAAEDEAAAERQRAASARKETADSQLSLVTTAISNVTQTLDAQEAQYATALAAGDHALAAKINREMTLNSSKLTRLEEGKQQMEARAKAPPEPPAPRRAADPVEDFVSRLQGPRRERAADWIRSHAEFVTDKAKERKLYAAHELAMADGHEPNTDAYFEAVEETLKLRQPARASDDDPPPPPAPRRSAPPAAPPSRSGNGNGGSRNPATRATAAQIEAAEISGLSIEDYLKNAAAMKAEGRLN